jgi:hypothetical protein
MIIDKDYPGLEDRGGVYYYPGSIVTDESVEVVVPLKVGGSIEVGGSLNVGGWLEVGGWLNVGGDMTIDGIKTAAYLSVVGRFRFRISIYDTHARIGCQLKSREEWLAILDRDDERYAKALGDDGSMWANRDLIRSLIGVGR